MNKTELIAAIVAETGVAKKDAEKVLAAFTGTVEAELKKGGKIIVNEQKINPMPVITGAAKYPENILEKLREVVDVTSLDALSLAMQAGTAKAANVVLIGVMAKSTSIPYEEWIETIRASVPPKFVDVNVKAFELGYHL